MYPLIIGGKYLKKGSFVKKEKKKEVFFPFLKFNLPYLINHLTKPFPILLSTSSVCCSASVQISFQSGEKKNIDFYFCKPATYKI